MATDAEVAKSLETTEDDTITEEELAAIKVPEGPKFDNRLPSDHFLSRYLNYGHDISDTYPEFWYVCGLHILSVISDKKLWVELRQMTVYPNLYIIITGKSTTSRKTTAISKSNAMLRGVKADLDESLIPTEFSPEAFIEHMHGHNHASWVRDEAAGVLSVMKKEYMRGFKDTLMLLYDCEPIHRKLRTGHRRDSENDFRVDDPYLNVLWATTNAALAANTNLTDTLSGFMARFLYASPQRPKERWLPLEEGPALISDFESIAISHLERIDMVCRELEPTAMHLSPESQEYWTAWQCGREQFYESSRDEHGAQIFGRLSPTVVKLAILFELGSSDFDPSRPIRLEYIQEACRQIDEYFMPTAKAIYESVGCNIEKNIVDRITQFVKANGGKATQREISQHVKIKSRDLEDYLETMEENGTISIKTEESGKPGRPAKWILLRIS